MTRPADVRMASRLCGNADSGSGSADAAPNASTAAAAIAVNAATQRAMRFDFTPIPQLPWRRAHSFRVVVARVTHDPGEVEPVDEQRAAAVHGVRGLGT